MSTERVESSKKSEAHEDKRQFIIEQCASLFDRVGYHKASMQMLAEEVGIGKPTLYHYFPSKHAILYAIHDAHMDRLLVGLDRPEGDHPLDSLQSACADILTQIAEHPGYVRAFMDHYADLEGEMRAKIRQQRQDYFQKLISIIEDGVAQGSINPCDPTMATYAFLGMCNWAYKWYPAMASEVAPAEAAQQLCAPLFEGLRKG